MKDIAENNLPSATEHFLNTAPCEYTIKANFVLSRESPILVDKDEHGRRIIGVTFAALEGEAFNICKCSTTNADTDAEHGWMEALCSPPEWTMVEILAVPIFYQKFDSAQVTAWPKQQILFFASCEL